MRCLSFAVIALLACFACTDAAQETAEKAPEEVASAAGSAETGASPAVVAEPADGLVFLRPTASGGADLWLGSVSKGSVAPLRETENWIESSPHWVPSVLRVAYVSRPKDDPATSRLMLIDPESGEAFTATERTGWQEGVAAVSSDERLLAYPFVAPEGQTPKQGIRLLDPMSSRDQVLTAVPGALAYPAMDFRPGTTEVAAQIHRPGRGDDIFLFSDVGKFRSLSNNPRWRDTNPGFTHLGDHLVFGRTRYPPLKPGSPGVADVCILNLELRGVECPWRTAGARHYGAKPSPVAAELVFVREQGGETDLFLSDLQGGSEQRLTQTPEAERSAVWSPDGQRIAFEAGPPSARRVRVVDLEGNVLFDEPGFAPDWTPPFL